MPWDGTLKPCVEDEMIAVVFLDVFDGGTRNIRTEHVVKSFSMSKNGEDPHIPSWKEKRLTSRK
jgi:hypothetical protein